MLIGRCYGRDGCRTHRAGGQTEVVNNVVSDALEVSMVVAVAGMFATAVRRLRRGEIAVVRCASCGRPTSRAYPACKHCGVPR